MRLLVKFIFSKETREERKQKRKLRRELRKQKRAEKKRLSTRKWVLPAIIIAVIIYAVCDVLLQFKTSMEISPTLTTCWFTFWAVELWNLASITKKKVDVDYEGSFGTNLEQLHQEEENDADKPDDEEDERSIEENE